MADSTTGEAYKIRLEHLILPEGKEVLKNSNKNTMIWVCQRDIEVY